MKLAQIHQQADRFWQDETGLELSEYAVATALISLAVASAFTKLGSRVNEAINQLTGRITVA
jgi:Flp pilus assembly pilin Flp